MTAASDTTESIKMISENCKAAENRYIKRLTKDSIIKNHHKK